MTAYIQIRVAPFLGLRLAYLWPVSDLNADDLEVQAQMIALVLVGLSIMLASITSLRAFLRYCHSGTFVDACRRTSKTVRTILIAKSFQKLGSGEQSGTCEIKKAAPAFIPGPTSQQHEAYSFAQETHSDDILESVTMAIVRNALSGR